MSLLRWEIIDSQACLDGISATAAAGPSSWTAVVDLQPNTPQGRMEDEISRLEGTAHLTPDGVLVSEVVDPLKDSHSHPWLSRRYGRPAPTGGALASSWD